MISTSEHELAHHAAAPEATPASSRRLSILTQREIDDLYGLPRFTEEDRQLYFDLSAAEEARVHAMHTAAAKAHFVLQLGYFKAKRQFFSYPYHAVQEDLRYILGRHFPGRAGNDQSIIEAHPPRTAADYPEPFQLHPLW